MNRGENHSKAGLDSTEDVRLGDCEGDVHKVHGQDRYPECADDTRAKHDQTQRYTKAIDLQDAQAEDGDEDYLLVGSHLQPSAADTADAWAEIEPLRW